MKYIKLFEYFEDTQDDEHQGMWLHGGNGNFKGGNFLYVTDELKEALYYANIKDGDVWKLKDEYNYLVSWSIGHSEGMISRENIEKSGGFKNIFEIFIKL